MFHGATETEQEFSKVKEWIKAEHPGDVAPRVFGIDFYLQMVSQKGTLAEACAKKLHSTSKEYKNSRKIGILFWRSGWNCKDFENFLF